ncbi:MAG: TonB-dependent receptor [Omnitrophica WOR_2 bacterium]
MNRFILTIFFLSCLNVYSQKVQEKAVIKGRVFDVNSNEPLPFSNIIIYGTNTGTVSDTSGKFEFQNIHPGFIKLAASSVGYETYVSEEIMLTNSKIVNIDIPMVRSQIELEQVIVKASPFRKPEESPVSMRSLGIKELEKSPGGNRDVSKVIQALPGVASTVSFRNDVIVRGGGPSENKFLLDGIEIPNLNHFSTQGASGGPIGMINIDFIREIDFYSGAFPSNRGNTLSSILEMKQIDGNKERIVTKAAVGATDLSLALNGPLSDKTTFLFSARRSYLKFLFNIIGLPFLPTYNDFQFKVKTQFDKKNELTILGIGAVDVMKLNTGIENPDDGQQYILNYLPVFKQWNYAMGAVYRHYRKNSYDTWVFSRNMLNNESYKHENNDELKPFLQNYSSQEIENKLRYENTGTYSGYKLTVGAGLEYAKYNTSTFQKVFIPRGQDTLRELNFGSSFDLFKWNVFGQLSKSYFDNKLILSAGLRLEANNYSSDFSSLLKNWSPRFSATYQVTDKFYINGNWGHYLQQPAYTTLGYEDQSGNMVNKLNDLTFIKADHKVLGIEYRRNSNSRMTIEGFYKKYYDYPVSVNDSISLANKGGDFGVFGSEEVTSTGEGRAFGFEAYIRDRLFNTIDLITSYTFVRSEFKDSKEVYVPSAWDNRHILNITLAREFENDWYVGLRWRFVGGLPYTPYDLYRSSLIDAYTVKPNGYLDYNRFNTERLSPFHQLDLRVDKQFYFNKWMLTLYCDVQNAYNYQTKEQPQIIPVTDSNGNKLVVEGDPSRYQLKMVSNESGTVLPTIGIIVEF